nr:MAG TPA: hypothetical protein [Caudoviricetes sp.]
MPSLCPFPCIDTHFLINVSSIMNIYEKYALTQLYAHK